MNHGKRPRRFQPGDRVQVRDGYLAGRLATVVSMDDPLGVGVLFDFLNDVSGYHAPMPCFMVKRAFRKAPAAFPA